MKNKAALLWLMKQIKSRIPGLLLMLAAHVGQAVLGVAFALGTRQIIDCAVDGREEAFRNACLQQGMIIFGLLLCLAVYRHLRDRLDADLERDWKQRLLHGLLHGDYSAVSSYHSGELLNRLNNDVRTVDDGILTVLPNLAAMVTRLVAAAWVLALLDGTFTALIVAVGALAVIVTGILRRKLKSLHKQVSEHDGRVSGFLQETLEKLLVVQAMDLSDQVERRADDYLAQRYSVQRKRKNVSLAANTGISLMTYGAGFVSLVWCAFRLLQGQMSFGSLTAVTQLVSQLQSPFVGLSGVFPKYIAMVASAERLMELDAVQGQPESAGEPAQRLYSRMESLGAESLTFSYDRDRVLEEASFCLPKGAFAVITGPSGIGKSTVLKLLLGIFKPEQGQLYLDCGERILIDRTTRRLFAYVPQGNLIFSGTLRENLTIVNPEATEEEIACALQVSAMSDYLPQLPEGLDTVLGENGAGLSEGQAQRLAIARAVLGKAPILLLDECTSALDAQTEQTVLRRLRDLPDRTCIAVTHREAATAFADWQLELQDGKIHCHPTKP